MQLIGLFFATKKSCIRYARYGEGEAVVERELFATDVEGIERVGAVGAVFEQVFFGLRKFASCGVNFSGIQRFTILSGFILAEHGSRVDGKCCASLYAGQVFNGVVIEVGKRKVHNLLIYAAKL